MLDSFIIEELKRRKEREQRESNRPVLQLPVYDGRGGYEPRQEPHKEIDEPETDRGVIVIDI